MSARRVNPLGLTPPGVFLAIAEGRLTAASFSLTTDQLFQIALVAADPPSVGQQPKQGLGVTELRGEASSPRAMQYPLKHVRRGTNLYGKYTKCFPIFGKCRKQPLTCVRAKGALTASRRVALPCCQTVTCDTCIPPGHQIWGHLGRPAAIPQANLSSLKNDLETSHLYCLLLLANTQCITSKKDRDQILRAIVGTA